MSEWKAVEDRKDLYEGNKEAPEGMIWVCGACGRTSRWRYGFDVDGNECEKSHWWDESCMMNAVLCYEKGGQE